MTKLRFKGSKKQTKKSVFKSIAHDQQIERENSEDELKWILSGDLRELSGPLFFITELANMKFSFFIQEDSKELLLRPISDSFPTEINQILIGYSFEDGKYFAFKNAFGKYLGATKRNELIFESEAIGIQEQWIVTRNDYGFLLRSLPYNTYFSFQDCWKYEQDSKLLENNIPGESLNSSTQRSLSVENDQLKLRLCMSDAPLSFSIYHQLSSCSMHKSESDLDMIIKYKEINQWSKNHPVASLSDKQLIELGKKDCKNLNEYFLDQREKTKSDKYCK